MKKPKVEKPVWMQQLEKLVSEADQREGVIKELREDLAAQEKESNNLQAVVDDLRQKGYDFAGLKGQVARVESEKQALVVNLDVVNAALEQTKKALELVAAQNVLLQAQLAVAEAKVRHLEGGGK